MSFVLSVFISLFRYVRYVFLSLFRPFVTYLFMSVFLSVVLHLFLSYFFSSFRLSFFVLCIFYLFIIVGLPPCILLFMFYCLFP